MTITADVNEFKQKVADMFNRAFKGDKDIRVTMQGESMIYSKNKTSPELMTDQEYIESIPGLKEAILAGRDEKGEIFNWREEFEE